MLISLKQVEKLTLARKRDLIDSISNEILSLNRRQLTTYQPSIVGAVINLTNFGCGASLMRSMLDLLKHVYLNGDFTKLQSEFFELVIPMIQNVKASNHVKVSCCYLSSKIFKLLWPRCHTPPTKELVDCYFKIIKNSTDKFTKECSFKALKQIIKSNPSNLFQISGDLFKHLIKLMNSDKVQDVKVDIVKCLRVYVQSTLNYSSMHQLFDQVLQVSIKGLEDQNKNVLEQYILTLYYLLNLRLEESQQQGDIKTSFKTYNQQQREAMQGKDKKKQTQVFFDVPRTLADMISFLCAILVRIQSTSTNQISLDNSRYALGQVMSRLIESNRVHLEVLDPENIINPLLLCLINKTPGNQVQDLDSFKARELSIWVVQQALYSYESSQKIVILKNCLQCLLKKQLIMNKDTLETFQGFCKNQKMTTLLNESQIITLLRIVNEVIFRLQHLEIKKSFANEKELIDSIVPLIKDSGSNTIRLYATEVVKSLGYRCPHLIHELISIFLSLATITNADITSMRQVPYHIYSIDRSQMKQESMLLYENLNNLNYQCYSLGLLLSSLQQSLGGVPLALINQTINVAKGMILGNWKVGEDEDEFFFSNDLQKVDLQENQRREAGWFIFEGLIQLGNQWVGTKLSLFFKLLNSVFTKDMCVVNQLQIKDQSYCEKILNEFKIKKAALSTLKSFLQRSFVLLNSSLMKLVSSYLINAVTFFLNHDKDKKDIIKLFQTYFPTEYAQVKIDLYDCLLLIPSTLYQTKFVNLLHVICEEIVSEDIQELPSLHKQVLHFEDKPLLKKYQQPLDKFISQQNANQLKIAVAEENFIIEQNIQLFRLDVPISKTKFSHLSVKQALLNNSISLFAEIFSSQHLNPKNKQQLIKHFMTHTQPATQQPIGKKDKQAPVASISEQKINKVVSIALSILLVCKNLAKRGEVIDQEIEAQIKTLFKNCEQYQNMILLRIQSEGIVFLNIPQILKDPQHKLDNVLKEQEISFQHLTQVTQTDEWFKKSKVICVLGNICRYLDYETILQPQNKRILELFMKLSKENNNTTDIKTNQIILYSLGRIVEAQMRQNINPINEMRRAQIIVKEFIEVLFLRDEKMSKDVNILKTSLDFIKNYLIIDIDQVHHQIEPIIEKILYILTTNGILNIEVKLKCIEILGAFLYKGYFYVVKNILQQKHKQNLLPFILNIMNNSFELCGTSYQDLRILKKIQESSEKIMNYNDEFEKLINFKQNQNAENQKLLLSQNGKRALKTLILRNCTEILYIKTFKISTIIDFKESLEHVKQIINYSHTTQLQKYEENKKPGEKQSEIAQESSSAQNKISLSYNINERVRFIVGQSFKTYISLYGKVDTADHQHDLKRYLGQLISLGFSIISDESMILKRVGFSMVISLVKLFKNSIEKIGDDDDDPNNQMKIYLNNPLLLEQYEAQLFSIIRQNVAITQAKLIDPYIVMKNYQLIYYFLTTPICRDQSIIVKIVQMLTDNLQANMQIFNSSEMVYFEKALTDMHFKKLILLSKLLVMCLEGQEFKRVETNPKLILEKLNSKSQDQQIEKVKNLPSKFQKEDRDRILECLQPQVVKNIVKHIQAALHDSLMILSMPKSSIKSIKDFTFIYKNGSRSAYNHETIEKSVQYFIKVLSIISDYEKLKQTQVFEVMNEDQSLILNGLLTFNLSKEFQTKNQNQKKNDDNQDENQEDDKVLIYNLVQLKITYLKFLNRLISNQKLVLRSQDEIDQYLTIIDNLQSYGVTEISEEIVQFYNNLISTQNFGLNKDKQVEQVGLVENSLSKLLRILCTVQPELIGQSRENSEEQYTKNQINLIRSCTETINLITNQLLQINHQNATELLKKVITFIIYRVGISISDIKNESLMKFYTNIIVQITNQTRQFLIDNNLDEMIGEIIILISKQLIEKCNSNVQAQQYIILNITNLMTILRDQEQQAVVSNVFDQIFSMRESQQQMVIIFVKLFTQQMLKDIHNTTYYGKHLLSLSISSIFQIIQQNSKGNEAITQPTYQLMQELITFMMTVYAQTLTSNDRTPELVSQYMLMIFTIIQDRTLEASFRNAQAELIFKLYQMDQNAFKGYLLSPDITQNEKALIQKIIQQFAVLAATGGLQKSQGTIGQGAQGLAKPSQASQIQAPDQKAAQGKIQLTMSFNKK